METGKDVHLGSLHRKSLLNEWSIGPFLAICIPGFLSLQNALQGNQKHSYEGPTASTTPDQSQRTLGVILCIFPLYLQLILRKILEQFNSHLAFLALEI